MNTFIVLLQSTIPSLLVLAVAVYFFHAYNEQFLKRWKDTVPLLKDDRTERLLKSFIEREEKLQLLSIKKENQRITLPLRLQAYERFVLLLERITLSRLLLRVAEPALTAQQLQHSLILNIRNEFEHNLSQQIYISETSWEWIKKTVEESIQLINTSASTIPADSSASVLISLLMEMENSGQAPQTHKVISHLHAEAQFLLAWG